MKRGEWEERRRGGRKGERRHENRDQVNTQMLVISFVNLNLKTEQKRPLPRRADISNSPEIVFSSLKELAQEIFSLRMEDDDDSVSDFPKSESSSSATIEPKDGCFRLVEARNSFV